MSKLDKAGVPDNKTSLVELSVTKDKKEYTQIVLVERRGSSIKRVNHPRVDVTAVFKRYIDL